MIGVPDLAGLRQRDAGPHLLEDEIAGFMAERVIELLEMIDIEHDHCQRLFGTLHAPQFATACFLQIAAVARPIVFHPQRSATDMP